MTTTFDFLSTNKDTFTLLIAIAGFLLSAGQLIYALWSKRINLSIELQNIETSFHSNKDRNTFLLTICNNSSSSISITKMILIDNLKKEYSCLLTHRWISERYYPTFPETDIPRTERVFSVDFPIVLDAHQSIMGSIVFDLPKDTVFKNRNHCVTIRFITNKKTVTYKLPVSFENRPLLSI